MSHSHRAASPASRPGPKTPNEPRAPELRVCSLVQYRHGTDAIRRTATAVYKAPFIYQAGSLAGSAGGGQAIAAHESPRTTKLYDRTADEVTVEDIEKIGI